MTSDWNDRANKRRDERHTKIPDEPTRRTSKKDTKLWCRGKPGVLHTPQCEQYMNYNGKLDDRWRNLCCSTCGKLLDRYWPRQNSTEPKPDWVDK